MKKLNTQTYNAYELTAGPKNRKFIIIVDEQIHKTFIYMETDTPGIYYQEDRFWMEGKPEEAAQEAADYINKHIETMEDCRDYFMEKSKTGKPIYGYARRINKNELAA